MSVSTSRSRTISLEMACWARMTARASTPWVSESRVVLPWDTDAEVRRMGHCSSNWRTLPIAPHWK
ncbi:hypothetical protein ACN28S_34280 [Cystobacter fuscus]